MTDNTQILVDTSAWIAAFRGECSAEMQEYIKRSIIDQRIVTCNIIILELLQGCTTKNERHNLQEELEAHRILPLTEAVWSLAYKMGFDLRRKGLTIPTVDSIIAALAMNSDCLLLHHDRHFSLMQKYFTSLSLQSI